MKYFIKPVVLLILFVIAIKITDLYLHFTENEVLMLSFVYVFLLSIFIPYLYLTGRPKAKPKNYLYTNRGKIEIE